MGAVLKAVVYVCVCVCSLSLTSSMYFLTVSFLMTSASSPDTPLLLAQVCENTHTHTHTHTRTSALVAMNTHTQKVLLDYLGPGSKCGVPVWLAMCVCVCVCQRSVLLRTLSDAFGTTTATSVLSKLLPYTQICSTREHFL